jgi:hypothetical protein
MHIIRPASAQGLVGVAWPSHKIGPSGGAAARGHHVRFTCATARWCASRQCTKTEAAHGWWDEH